MNLLCIVKQHINKYKEERSVKKKKNALKTFYLRLYVISNLLICFCSFDLSYPILEKNTFI